MAREIARSIAPSRAGEPNGVIELPAVMGRKKADGAQDARGARGGALNRGSSAPEIPQTVGDHGRARRDRATGASAPEIALVLAVCAMIETADFVREVA
jgi:hypothetical protein